MMKRIDLLRLVFVVGMFLFASFSVNAATSDVLDDAAWLDTMKKGNGDSFYPPYDKNWQGEQISTESGGLNMRVTDLTLPGKNGLDLNLTREYSNIKMSTYRHVFGSRVTKPRPAYVYADPITGKSYYILFDSEEAMLHIAPDEFFARSDMERAELHETVGNIKRTYYPIREMYRSSESESTVRLVRDKTLGVVNINVTGYFDLEAASMGPKYKLYNNWAFVLPQLDFMYEVQNGQYAYRQHGTLTDFDGNTYSMNTRTWFDTIENKWKSDDFVIEANGYSGEYVSYNPQENEPGIVFNRKVTDSKGRVMYFNYRNIVAIKDKYQNQILFTYDENQRLSTITDSYGRVVTFSYSDTGTMVSYTQPETNEQRTISYETNILLNPNDPDNMYSTDDTYQLIVTDAEGNITKYLHEKAEIAFTASNPNCSNDIYGYMPGYAATLTTTGYRLVEIQHPTSLTTKYEYMRRGIIMNNGSMSRDKITCRYDILDNTQLNRYEYTYNNYAEGQSGNQSYTGTVTRALDGYKVTNKYSKYNVPILIEEYDGTTLKKKTENTYNEPYVYNPKTIMVVTEEIQTAYDTAQKKVTTNYTYDSKLNKTSETTGDYAVQYTYDNKYSLPLTTTYKRDADTTVVVTNTLTADEKNIASSVTTENGAVKAKTEYTYDGFGNITAQKIWEKDDNADGVLDDNDTAVTVHTDYTYYNDKTQRIYRYVENMKDADGNTVTAENPLDDTTNKIGACYLFDYYGNIQSMTDPNQVTTTVTYDKLNRPVTKSFADGGSQQITYNTAQNYMESTDENGNKIKMQYDPAGRQQAKYIYADGAPVLLEEYAYDAASRLQSKKVYQTADKYTVTAYTYDALDRILTERTENQAQELVSENTYAYENISWDKSKVTVTPTGDGTITPAKTVKYYDNRGRLVQEDVADATTTYTTTYQYDYLENVVSMKNPRANAEGTGNTVAREYDYAGNVIQETNAAGKFTTTTYDMMGRKIAATDYNGNTATIQYDSLGRQICTQSPFDGQNMSKTKNYYDPAGNLIKTKVQSNAPGEQESYHTTEYQYDVRGRLVAQTGIDGEIQNVVQYTYDNGGRILGMTTGLGQVSQSPMEEASAATTRYTYNEWNLPVTTTDPLGKTEQSAYDYLGNTVCHTDKMGVVTTTVYDSRKLPVSITAAADGSSEQISYTYNIMGNRISMTDATGTTTYSYDSFGRQTGETVPDGVSKAYAYDASSNRTAFTLQQNGSVLQSASYTYNQLDQLESVTNDGTTTTYQYDDNGNTLSQTTGSRQTQYTYNQANQLLQIQNKYDGTVQTGFTYNYYLDGNQKNKTDQAGQVTAYLYDGLGRLKSETAGEETTGYAYDLFGNRVQKTASGETTSYTYDLNNRLISEASAVQGQAAGKQYYYDANGNLIHETENVANAPDGAPQLTLQEGGEEVASYSYNLFGKMTGYQKGDTTASYSYNGDGLRYGKTVNGVTTRHVWDGANITADITGAEKTFYARGTGLIFSEANGQKQYYAFNGHGDTVSVTDTQGNLLQGYDYDAFGNEKGTAQTISNPFRYCGEYYDGETGLIYLRARYYAPKNGRFTQEDPHWNTQNMIYGDHSMQDRQIPSIMAIRQSINLYAYCVNDPIQLIDPNGEEPEDASVLSRKDYLTVLYLQVAFRKAWETGNREAMDGAAEQAAKIRQKPEYTGKFKSQWPDGVYKKTYVPREGYKGDNGGVYVSVRMLETDTDVYWERNQIFSDVSSMLGGASGSPILDQYVGPVASVISLFVDENYGNKLDVGTGIVTIKIYDYKPGQNLEINCTVVSSGVKIRERAITYFDWSAGGRQ